MIQELNSSTLEYTSLVSREYRNKEGQFFSSYTQVKQCIKLVQEHLEFENLNILEPSAGTGQFVDVLQNTIINCNLTVVEKDTILCKYLRKDHPELNIISGDFLKYESEIKYDLIIGNPPYVELSEYKDVKYTSTCINGRYNIYALFIEHAIKLLNDKGILCFILPPSLMSGPTFDKIRNYIKQYCNILNIVKLENFNSEVSQDVNIYVFQKSTDINLNFVMRECFTLDKENNEEECVLLKSLFTVSTGSIVWNQVKDQLTNEKKIKLIYSSDVGNINSKNFTIDDVKKPYVETNKKPVNLPAIFMTRNKKPRHELVEEFNESLIGENHVNIILGKLEDLRLLDKYLSSQKCKDYISSNSNTLNFSKTQLENIPISL